MSSSSPYTSTPSAPSIRTFSSGSTTLQGPTSPTSTLASTSSRPTGLGIYGSSSLSATSSPPTSPTTGSAERNFFGALVQKARTRSRSRSRSRVHRSRSRSPLPPQTTTRRYYQPHQPPPTATMGSMRPAIHPLAPAPAHHAAYRPYEPRRLESRSSTSSSEDFYYGRHSNQWLFGNFSFRDTVRDVCRRTSSEKPRN